jgi:3-deoxy-D-manno-octulosonic-acid transferase
VGGGMKKGRLHNTLEPAAYRIPVITGRYFSKFQEAVLLEKKGGIYSVQSPNEFKKIYLALMNDAKLAERMGKVNKDYVLSGKGASQRIVEIIRRHSID